MTNNILENKLIKNIAEGDAIAFEEIFKKYNKKVYTFSYRYLKNKEDAQGIVQEVFLSLWQNAGKMHADSNVKAYLFTITFNAIRKKFRKLSREKKYLKAHESSIFENYDEISEIEYNDLLDKAKSLIDQLPPQQKKVFQLRQDKGLTNSEIANLIHISKKTVENHLNSARCFLRKSMREAGLLSSLLLWLILN